MKPIELIDRVIDVMHKPPEMAREHEESERCWCQPTLDYTDPVTSSQVWVHHEPH